MTPAAASKGQRNNKVSGLRDQKRGAQLTPPPTPILVNPHQRCTRKKKTYPSASEDAARSDPGRGGGVRRLRLPLRAGGPDEQAHHTAGLRRQTVWQGVHPGGHLHLRRLAVETVHGGGLR